MTSNADALLRVGGRYAIYGEIAGGGMATVHYGRLRGPSGFSRTVAIKRLHAHYAHDPEFVAMFLDEARLAARINHPNVVSTLDVVSTEDELFLVMDYVPGESLSRLVKATTAEGHLVPVPIVLAIMSNALHGLHAAHEATNERGEALGLVHRDVSPQNILVGVDGLARVLDFGIAKAAGRMQTTREGQLKGKLSYMSPEQLRGGAVDRRSDVFAAAVVLWEALTGCRLFKGDNEGAIVTKILEGAVVPPSLAPFAVKADEPELEAIRSVDAIVLKGLSADLNDRFGTAREMAAALEGCFVDAAGASEVGAWVERFSKAALANRARLVACIESASAVSTASTTAGDGEEATKREVLAPTGSEPENVTAGLAVVSGADAPPKKQHRGLFAVALAFAALAAALISAATVRKLNVGRVSASEAHVTIPSASALPVPDDALTPASSTFPDAPAVPAPSGSGAYAAAPRRKMRPTSSASPAISGGRVSPGSAVGCNPPSTRDADGFTHFKPECF